MVLCVALVRAFLIVGALEEGVWCGRWGGGRGTVEGDYGAVLEADAFAVGGWLF